MENNTMLNLHNMLEKKQLTAELMVTWETFIFNSVDDIATADIALAIIAIVTITIIAIAIETVPIAIIICSSIEEGINHLQSDYGKLITFMLLIICIKACIPGSARFSVRNERSSLQPGSFKAEKIFPVNCFGQ